MAWENIGHVAIGMEGSVELIQDEGSAYVGGLHGEAR